MNADSSSARPIARLLHLSDLHLGHDFADAGGDDRTGLINIAETKAFRMQAHDPLILMMLPLAVETAGENSRRACALAHSLGVKSLPLFDQVLVTGDISTDATDEARFQFALTYLQGKCPLPTAEYTRIRG